MIGLFCGFHGPGPNPPNEWTILGLVFPSQDTWNPVGPKLVKNWALKLFIFTYPLIIFLSALIIFL